MLVKLKRLVRGRRKGLRTKCHRDKLSRGQIVTDEVMHKNVENFQVFRIRLRNSVLIQAVFVTKCSIADGQTDLLDLTLGD